MRPPDSSQIPCKLARISWGAGTGGAKNAVLNKKFVFFPFLFCI